jgi:hypothetical protein
LVDAGETLSIVPCNSNTTPSGPLLKGADRQPIPSWGFVQKTVKFQSKLFSLQFLQAAVAGPIQGIDFLRRFKVTETSQIFFACTAAALSALQSFLPSFNCSVPPPVSLPPGTASPPTASLDRVHQVRPASFYCQGNQSIRDQLSPALPVIGPNQMQPIPDSVFADVKILLQKFFSILRTGDMKPTPKHGVEHPIHTGSNLPVFAKSCHLDLEKLEIAKADFKRLESPGIICCSKSPWASPLHIVLKMTDLGSLLAITAISIW